MQNRLQKLVQQRKNHLANSRLRMMRQNYNNFIKSSNNHENQEDSNSLISKEKQNNL